MLLIICCILGGFIIIREFIEQKLAGKQAILAPVQTAGDFLEKIRPYLGIISIVVAVWAFFSPNYSFHDNMGFARQDFIGDLIPAIFAFFTGILLSLDVLEYINFSKDQATSNLRRERIQKELSNQKTLIGLLSILFGLLHILDYVYGGIPLI